MIALGAYFVHVGLDRSNMISGVVGLFVSIAGLIASIISLIQARASVQPMSPRGTVRMSQQSGTNSTNIQAGGDMTIGDNSKLGGS